jgi:hypothetical protein
MQRLGRLWVVAVLSILAASTQAATNTLFAATAAGAPGELYTLNPSTGAVIQDIGPTNDAIGTNYPITGLAFHPITQLLYGSVANSNPAVAAKLVAINPDTAQVTVIGNFDTGATDVNGRPATMTDLAFDAAGNLYGVGSIGGPNLYSINIATGKATVIGSSGISSTTGGGLAISSGNTFYGTPTSGRFGTYNSSTGAYVNIGNPAKPAGTGAYTALEFDGAVLYGLNTGPGSPPPTHIVTIDPATAAVTDIGASLNSLDAIAFPVPEPSSATVVVGGIMFILIRRRRCEVQRLLEG